MHESTPSRTSLLNTLEHRVESHLRDAISIFQNLNDADLLRPSSTGGWSIAQCLEHLNSYGFFYLPEIKRALDGTVKNSAVETFKSTWLGNYFTRMMDPQTGKRKFKAFKNHIPPAELDAYAVIATFIAQQESLLSYIKEARSVDLNEIKIPLSICRWITFKLGDAFQFLIAHNERHLVQAKKNVL